MITETDLWAAVARDPSRAGLSSAPDRVSLLGHGESYDAWHVATRTTTETPATDVVVRVARRAATELPRAMADEFACLARLPRGVGPLPISLDEAGEWLGTPSVVVSFVPGEVVLDRDRWTPDLLARLARVIATLHTEPHERCGPLDDPTRSRVSIVGAFEAGLGWWLEHHPDIVADPEVLRLLPIVRAHLAEREPFFETVDRFALVHGDLIAANVLVDDGEPRLVDWEWAEIDDPARDLGYLGGALASPGQQAALTRDQVEHLAAAYLEAAPSDVRAVETHQSLLARRDAWEVCASMLSSLHERRLLAEGRGGPDSAARVATATRGLSALTSGGGGGVEEQLGG